MNQMEKMNMPEVGLLSRRQLSRRQLLGSIAAVAALLPQMTAAAGRKGDFGRYLDELHVKMLDDGRKVELLSIFRYSDPDEMLWTADKGFVSDGASIPRALWSLVGGPLDGGYRKAAIIHDYFCETRTRAWRATHKVFFFAMRAAGVGIIKARSMYFGVLVGGPRWGVVRGAFVTVLPTYSDEEIRQLLALRVQIDRRPGISLSEVEKIALDYSAEKFPSELRG